MMILPPDELRNIISEMKKPLPPEVHDIRDLPGKGKWVFLPWQEVRERLDQVYPAWISDYSDITILNNDAICRCGITILGVRKEAVGSMPVSVISSNGNEMTRGSVADRVAAESLKNAAEQWGVGRYLDDQVFTIKYLWDNKEKLTEKNRQYLQLLIRDYKISIGAIAPKPIPQEKPGSIIHDIAGISPISTISEAQVKRLWAVARNELKLTNESVKAALLKFGLESTKDIPLNKYDQVMTELENLSTVKF